MTSKIYSIRFHEMRIMLLDLIFCRHIFVLHTEKFQTRVSRIFVWSVPGRKNFKGESSCSELDLCAFFSIHTCRGQLRSLWYLTSSSLSYQLKLQIHVEARVNLCVFPKKVWSTKAINKKFELPVHRLLALYFITCAFPSFLLANHVEP